MLRQGMTLRYGVIPKVTMYRLKQTEMKHITWSLAFLIVLMVQTMTGWAQTELTHTVLTEQQETTVPDTATPKPLSPAGELMQQSVDEGWAAPVLPTMPAYGVPYGLGGYGLGGFSPYSSYIDGSSWRLHDGFNAQFGMSLSVATGKHAPKGVGFGQQAALAYVVPVTPKLSIAAGIYASNLDWGAWRRTDVGIGGTVAYQVNDRINLYAYGTKSFVPRTNDFKFRRDPFPLYLEQQRERIGAAAEFKIGENAMIGISVEHASY